MDNRLQAGPTSTESILDLLARTQSALSQTETDLGSQEPSRLYVSQRDWWLRRVTDSSRDVFRQGQWHLAVAKRLADGVRAHCRQRRWQEPSWKARTISSATRDYWQLQSSRIDWPPSVTGFTAVLPEYRSSQRGNAAADSSGQHNKRPRSPFPETTSPVETQRRSKRRRRVQADDPPPSVTSCPTFPPSPSSHASRQPVITQVDSESLLFGKRLQQTFWPATCSGDGHLRWPARELEEYSMRILQLMSKPARVTVEESESLAPMKGHMSAASSLPSATAGHPSMRRRRQKSHEYTYADSDSIPRITLNDYTSDHQRHHNTILRCRIRASNGADPLLTNFSLKMRNQSVQSLLSRFDASWTSLASPYRVSHVPYHRATPSARIDDQVRSGEAAYQHHDHYVTPTKLVDIFHLNTSTSTTSAAPEDQTVNSGGQTPAVRVHNIESTANPDPHSLTISRSVTALGRISRNSNTGDVCMELHPCSATGVTTLYIASEEPVSDVMTIGSLLLVNYWDIGMSLRALCRLQKLMKIAELELSTETEVEAVELATTKGAADTSDACPVESPMQPTIHGFQEFSAHGLLKSSSPMEWIRRFNSKLKIFRPVNPSDPRGRWIDVQSSSSSSPDSYSFLDPLSLDLPLEALLFLSRRHARDRRKSLQQVRSGASKEEIPHLSQASNANTSSFKLEQALSQSQAVRTDDLSISGHGSGSMGDGTATSSRPSLFRRSVNTIVRCPSWAIALRLSAWSKLPDNLWDCVTALVASAPTVGGPLFDPQAKAAANAPILRVKKEDAALTALLTLLNRSIRVPEPIILYSRMVRQVPLSAPKSEPDSLSAISNHFCLPVTLAVKGPSRTVRRLEFSWNPAEEMTLWKAVMHQIGPYITDEIFTKNDILNISIFLESWKQHSSGAHGKGPLKVPQRNLLTTVNWNLVAMEINQALRPFDRARSPVLCEAKFISLFSEMTCASFDPYGDYPLITKKRRADDQSSETTHIGHEGQMVNNETITDTDSSSIEKDLPAWEQLVLSSLQDPPDAFESCQRPQEDLWTFSTSNPTVYESLSRTEARPVHSAIEELTRFLDGIEDLDDARELELEGSIADQRPLIQAFPTSALMPNNLLPCQQVCSVETVKLRINRQVVYGPSAVKSIGLDKLITMIRAAWCVPCLGPFVANSMEQVVESPTLREVLTNFEQLHAPCKKVDEHIDALRSLAGDWTQLDDQSDKSSHLSKAREALLQISHSELEVKSGLTRGGHTLLSAVTSTSAEVMFRKTWDYQESGGLMSPIILRLLNDDKANILTQELTEWNQLCLHGAYRLTTSETSSVEKRSTSQQLVTAALLRSRQDQLGRLTRWMMGVTGTDQLIRLAGHLSQFHANSSKRRKLLLSQEGQIENYYLDHHLRAHVHTSPSCLTMLQAIRDIMTMETQQNEGRLDLGYREVTPATVFHHTCVNYNRIIFPCHASHDKLLSECETRMTSLAQVMASVANTDMMLKRNDGDFQPLSPKETLISHVADAPIVAAALLSRLDKACSALHLYKYSAREALPELLFQCIYRDFVPGPSPTTPHFPKAPYPKLKLNFEEAHKAMMATSVTDKSRRDPKNRKPWADPSESPSRVSRPGSSRNRSQPVQPYPQVHAYRPSSVNHMQRPPVIDFKQIQPIQQIPQSWNHIYDPNMRPAQYAMLSPNDAGNQTMGQHIQMQAPNLQSYPLPTIYQQQGDPWRRSASVKPVTYQTTTADQQGYQHQSWYPPGQMNPERYPQPTYIEFRPQQTPHVSHYQPTASSAGPSSRHYQHQPTDYSSYYQPYLQTAPAPGNAYIYGMYGVDRSTAAAATARLPTAGYNPNASQQSQLQSLSSDGHHKPY